MKNLTILLTLSALLLTSVLYAQQEPMYGQYIFNNAVINPAHAGAGEFNQWGVLSRFQFLGIPEAPRTNSAYANIKLPGQLGLAIGIYQDRLGIEENLQFQSDLAYHARLAEKWRLSGGIRLLVSNNRLDFLHLENLQPDDPYFANNVSSGVMMNVGAGVMLSSQRSFVGLSLPRVFKNEFQVYNPGNYSFSKAYVRHMLIYGGTNIPVSEQFMFMPSALFKYATSAPVQLDINAIFSYREVFDFGPLLRSNMAKGVIDATGFMVGLRLGENWYFGYAYEYPTNDLNLVTRQTHELSLRFLWGDKKEEQIRSPRYFL